MMDGYRLRCVVLAADGKITYARRIEHVFVEGLAACPCQIVKGLVRHADHGKQWFDEALQLPDAPIGEARVEAQDAHASRG